MSISFPTGHYTSCLVLQARGTKEERTEHEIISLAFLDSRTVISGSQATVIYQPFTIIKFKTTHKKMKYYNEAILKKTNNITGNYFSLTFAFKESVEPILQDITASDSSLSPAVSTQIVR